MFPTLHHLVGQIKLSTRDKDKDKREGKGKDAHPTPGPPTESKPASNASFWNKVIEYPIGPTPYKNCQYKMKASTVTYIVAVVIHWMDDLSDELVKDKDD